MKKFMLTLSDAGAAGGLAMGLSNVYNALGIILIVVNLGILIFNFIWRMRDRMKDGKFTNEEKAETAKEILELTEKIKELQEELNKYDNNKQ